MLLVLQPPPRREARRAATKTFWDRYAFAICARLARSTGADIITTSINVDLRQRRRPPPCRRHTALFLPRMMPTDSAGRPATTDQDRRPSVRPSRRRGRGCRCRSMLLDVQASPEFMRVWRRRSTLLRGINCAFLYRYFTAAVSAVSAVNRNEAR